MTNIFRPLPITPAMSHSAKYAQVLRGPVEQQVPTMRPRLILRLLLVARKPFVQHQPGVEVMSIASSSQLTVVRMTHLSPLKIGNRDKLQVRNPCTEHYSYTHGNRPLCIGDLSSKSSRCNADKYHCTSYILTPSMRLRCQVSICFLALTTRR